MTACGTPSQRGQAVRKQINLKRLCKRIAALDVENRWTCCVIGGFFKHKSSCFCG
jgi:hypothetical protein